MTYNTANTASEIERYMIELLNAERAARGIDTLQIEQNLNESAEQHSQWMLQANVFSHTGKNNSEHEDRIKDAGFDMSGSWRTGENLAMRSINDNGSFKDEVDAMMEGLMNSPGHKANILRESFDYIGIGIEVGFYTEGGVTYQVLMATQNFGATSETVLLDWETGTNASDKLSGTKTGDLIRGKAGNDTIVGGAGQDVLEGQAGNDKLDGGGGGDELNGGTGRDTLLGGAGQDSATGGGGQDTARGGKGGDVIKGGTGNDKLFGQAGADKLYGQADNDRLDGGTGNDLMDGGAGKDTFVFRQGGGKDKVADFNKSQDRIELDASLWNDAHGKYKAIDKYAEVTDAGVLFDFGTDELLLKGLGSINGLEDRIDLI